MKARINTSGHLEIKRKKEYKQQDCPFNEDSRCGDWCPLFRELEAYSIKDNEDKKTIRLDCALAGCLYQIDEDQRP